MPNFCCRRQHSARVTCLVFDQGTPCPQLDLGASIYCTPLRVPSRALTGGTGCKVRQHAPTCCSPTHRMGWKPSRAPTLGVSCH